jgi:hypothetical protein
MADGMEYLAGVERLSARLPEVCDTYTLVSVSDFLSVLEPKASYLCRAVCRVRPPCLPHLPPI